MPAGRPPLYDDPEEVKAIIDDYFLSVTHIHPETEQEISRPTMAGLAYALKMSRQSLINYGNKEEFFDTIKRARDRVEVALEENLYGNNVTGTIFNLKNNFGWKDKTEQEVNLNARVTELSDEELDERIRELSEEG